MQSEVPLYIRSSLFYIEYAFKKHSLKALQNIGTLSYISSKLQTHLLVTSDCVDDGVVPWI